MLVARLVGPSGEVVGVERDRRSVARASTRMAQVGLNNIQFVQADVRSFESAMTFDAVVGRMILQFVPDPPSVLRSLSRLVRAGGIVAFQEASFRPLVVLCAHLPLWSAVTALIEKTMRLSGANTEIGLDLHGFFQEAGLPAPSARMEILLGSDLEFIRLVADVLRSLRTRQPQTVDALSATELGDLDTLVARLHAEIVASRGVVPFVGLVGAWSQKPTN